jgi:hypothetical protein
MILALLPLATAVAAPPAVLSVNDPDLRCMVAVSFAMGAAQSKGADAETVGSMSAVFMYFLGKSDARHPGENYAPAFARVVAERDYEQRLPADLQRCGAEAEARGAMLKQLDEQLRPIVPQAPASAG